MILRSFSFLLILSLLLGGIYCSALPAVGRDIKAAARSGDAAAQVILARMYFEGTFGSHDPVMSARWLLAAVDQGDPDAMNILGRFYLSGVGVELDEARGLSLLREAADRGQPQAQAYMAYAYGEGAGVERDTVEFLRWTRRAAENGDARSRYNLAVLYLTGSLVSQDVPAGRALLELSADQGFTEAQVALGELLIRNLDQPSDLVEAGKWFAIAGTKGHPRAEKRLHQIVEFMSREEMDEAGRRANAWLRAKAAAR